MSPLTLSPSQLRKRLRKARGALDVNVRRRTSALACGHIARHRWFHAARRVALYMPFGAETDPLFLLKYADASRHAFFVPLLADHGRLHFASLSIDAHWRKNRFGIPEPQIPTGLQKRPIEVDLVITPLTGFDAVGNRLGAGGGFYDRSFAFRQHRAWGRPRLLGIAFEAQRCDKLPSQPWDVPLDAVATESGLQEFDR